MKSEWDISILHGNWTTNSSSMIKKYFDLFYNFLKTLLFKLSILQVLPFVFFKVIAIIFWNNNKVSKKKRLCRSLFVHFIFDCFFSHEIVTNFFFRFARWVPNKMECPLHCRQTLREIRLSTTVSSSASSLGTYKMVHELHSFPSA